MAVNTSTVNLSQNFMRISMVERSAVVPSPEETRDRIINSYRDEIKNHQARERDYQMLQQVMLDL